MQAIHELWTSVTEPLGEPAYPSVSDYAASRERWTPLSRVVADPSITLITATYNSEATLEETIASVEALEHPSLEYLVVDGGSSDRTLEIIRDNANAISAFISEPDQGMYDAFNKGIAYARGELVRILNSDDRIPADAVRIAEEAYQQCGPQVLLKGDLRTIDLEGRAIEVLSDRRRQAWMPPGFPVVHPTWFVPRRIYEEYGLYSTRYRISGDTEYLHRLLARGVEVKHLPHVLAEFRTHGVSSTVVGPLTETFDINSRYLGRAKAAAMLANSVRKRALRYAFDAALGRNADVLRGRIKSALGR